MQLFVRAEPQIWAYVRCLVRQPNDAEEIRQETALVLWRKFEQFTPGSDFLRWAYRITYWEVRKYQKNNRRNILQFSQQVTDVLAEDTVAMSAELHDLQWALARCVSKLKSPDRKIFELRYQAGATTKGVAGRLGKPVETVNSAMKRIRRSLSTCLNRALFPDSGKHASPAR